MNREIDYEELCAIQEAANVADLPPERIYRNYVGRGLSQPCFGLVYETNSQLFHFFVELSRRLDEVLERREYAALAEELARSAKTDILGKRAIVYFPGFVLAEVEVPQ